MKISGPELSLRRNSESAWILQLLTQELRVALHLTAVSKMFQWLSIQFSTQSQPTRGTCINHNIFAIWMNPCQLIPNKGSGSGRFILGCCLQASNIIRKGTTCQLPNCSQYWMVSISMPKCPEESRVSRSQSATKEVQNLWKPITGLLLHSAAITKNMSHIYVTLFPVSLSNPRSLSSARGHQLQVEVGASRIGGMVGVFSQNWRSPEVNYQNRPEWIESQEYRILAIQYQWWAPPMAITSMITLWVHNNSLQKVCQNQ